VTTLVGAADVVDAVEKDVAVDVNEVEFVTVLLRDERRGRRREAFDSEGFVGEFCRIKSRLHRRPKEMAKPDLVPEDVSPPSPVRRDMCTCGLVPLLISVSDPFVDEEVMTFGISTTLLGTFDWPMIIMLASWDGIEKRMEFLSSNSRLV